MLDTAIADYEKSIASRIETQVNAYIATAVVDQMREFGGNLDVALQELTAATVTDIEAAYNLDMRVKLLDIAIAVTIKQIGDAKLE